MPASRFFVSGMYAPGDVVSLAPDDARKLGVVLRARGGERIEIVDSRGVTYAATLEDGVECARLGDALPSDGIESPLRIVLAQAIPKGQKMDYVVEKATELGVAAIVPVRSARVAGERTGEHKHERWKRIAKTAAQQSGRSVVPAIEPEVGWAALCSSFGDYDRVLVPWELAAPEPLRDVLPAHVAAARSALVIIGPEGGFSGEEVEGATRAGAHPISLGRRILRTETAALVVVAAILYARGEL